MPTNCLSVEEVQQISVVCHQPEYASSPPSQIVPRLADKEVDLVSESTFYRVRLQLWGSASPWPSHQAEPSKTADDVHGLRAVLGVDLGQHVATFSGARSLVLSVSGGGCVQP